MPRYVLYAYNKEKKSERQSELHAERKSDSKS
jgi:hypothetical protein